MCFEKLRPFYNRLKIKNDKVVKYVVNKSCIKSGLNVFNCFQLNFSASQIIDYGLWNTASYQEVSTGTPGTIRGSAS